MEAKCNKCGRKVKVKLEDLPLFRKNVRCKDCDGQMILDTNLPNLSGSGKFIIIGIVIVVIILLFFTSIYTIDQGDRGVLLTFGKASTNIVQPGLHFKMPIVQSVIVMSVRTQTISFDNKQSKGTTSEYTSLAGASKDLQDVAIGSVVNYHINEKDVLDIYKKYGDEKTYQINILEPLIRQTVKTVSAHYTAEQLVTERQNFSDEVSNLLNNEFNDKSGIFERYNVVNFEFSTDYANAIEQKAVQAQLLEKSKITLQTTEVEAQTRIAQATGEAEAIKIQVNAINQQGGQNYVQLQMISRWNGVMPLVTGQGSAILDMRSLNTVAGTIISNNTSN